MSDLVPASDAQPPANPQAGRQPWEKRPNEGMRAFHAFSLYRDLGYYRTHRKVADALGMAEVSIASWSSQHDWVDRVELYEVERDRRRLEAEMSSQEQARQAEGVAARALLRKALQRLQGDEEVFALDANELDASDVAKFVAEGIRIQRLALGMPTDFSKGALSMTFNEVQNLVRELVHGLLPLIPPEKHPQAIAIVRGVSATGGSSNGN